MWPSGNRRVQESQWQGTVEGEEHGHVAAVGVGAGVRLRVAHVGEALAGLRPPVARGVRAPGGPGRRLDLGASRPGQRDPPTTCRRGRVLLLRARRHAVGSGTSGCPGGDGRRDLPGQGAGGPGAPAGHRPVRRRNRAWQARRPARSGLWAGGLRSAGPGARVPPGGNRPAGPLRGDAGRPRRRGARRVAGADTLGLGRQNVRGVARHVHGLGGLAPELSRGSGVLPLPGSKASGLAGCDRSVPALFRPLHAPRQRRDGRLPRLFHGLLRSRGRPRDRLRLPGRGRSSSARPGEYRVGLGRRAW